MSNYSSSSQGDAYYSSPGPQQYTLVTSGIMNDPRNLSQVSPGFIYVNFLSQPLLSAVRLLSSVAVVSPILVPSFSFKKSESSPSLLLAVLGV